MRMSENVLHDVLAPQGDETLEVGPFVLNLCAVRSPLEISPPRLGGLVKYGFFVSRGLEGDRERFWLHMGYFESREEAEEMLEILHPIYPLAFVTAAAVTFVPSDESEGSATRLLEKDGVST